MEPLKTLVLGSAMERFIHNENIRRYRRLLEEEKNEGKRNIIRKLLAEEEAKEIGRDLRPDRDKPTSS